MNPGDVLDALFRQWRELTLAETRNIELEAWDELAAVQRHKTALRSDILSREAALGGTPARFRPLIQSLIDMERDNLEALGRRLALQRHQLNGLEASTRTLHRIKGAYAPQSSRRPACFGTA